MNRFNVRLWTVAATLVSTQSFAMCPKEIYEGNPIDANYSTTIKEDGSVGQYFESPNKAISVLTYSGWTTRNYNNYRTWKLIVRNSAGKALFQDAEVAGWASGSSSGDHVKFLNRTSFSPDGKKLLLVLDDPNKRSYFGFSNKFTLVNASTGASKIIDSKVILGDWKEFLNVERQENFPIVFSADSKKVYLTDNHRIEIADAVTGKISSVLQRADFGYKSQFDKFPKNYEFEEGEWRSIEGREQFERVAFSPDTTRVLVSFAEDAPVLYDLQKQKVIKKFPLKANDVLTDFAMIDNDTVVGILSSDQMQVVSWNSKTNKVTSLLNNPSRKTNLQSMITRNGVSVLLIREQVNPDTLSERIVSFAGGKRVDFDLSKMKFLLKQQGYGANGSEFSVDDSGTYAMIIPNTGWDYSGAYIFNAKTGKLKKKIKTGYGSKAWFSGDGQSVFYSTEQGIKQIKI